MKNEKIKTNHSLFLTENKIEIKGISGVLSYQSKEIALSLPSSTLIISGTDLSLENFDTENGVATVTGTACDIRYKKGSDKLGFFKKLAK